MLPSLDDKAVPIIWRQRSVKLHKSEYVKFASTLAAVVPELVNIDL